MEAIEQQAFDATLQAVSGVKPHAVKRVLELLSEGNTVPFIARYRKEMTGGLDEVQIREIELTYQYQKNLAERKEEVTRLIAEQDKLTPELAQAIAQADKMQQVEDLYRPYRQKRRTKATIAREKGLEPLADWLLSATQGDVVVEATRYVDSEKDVLTPEDAIQGAQDIIAERISDDAAIREFCRTVIRRNGLLTSAVKDTESDEKKVYEGYYQFEQPLKKSVPHRTLALNRGEKEGILSVTISIDEQVIIDSIAKQIVKHRNSPAAPYVIAAIADGFKRLLFPSVERELRNALTEEAESQAIHVFGENLRNLLLQAPMKSRVILGLDPAYRTGCKLAIIDETGKVLDKGVIYPHPPASAQKRQEAGPILRRFIEQYGVDMVAIGNGTASRESEQFVAEQLKQIDRDVYYIIVNEAGASVYSASEIARKEFPDYQVEERSAVSIGRRLQDPLAELVKIEPKAIGVGQYQHDVSQKQLAEQLDFVVETAVNQVGVNLNTASAPLLQYVSGLNKTTAGNIVAYREANGSFTNRNQLKKVPRLGPKAFEQAVGFLRIVGGKDPFDNTGIHPESYDIAKRILQEAHVAIQSLGSDESVAKLKALSHKELSQQLDVAEVIVRDLIEQLLKPGRDVRDDVPAPLLRQDVLKLSDLTVGMALEGTVRNVVDFGAFVDIGVKQDGLVHISKLSQRFVSKPSDVVAVGDIVTVWIDHVDEQKGRIALTMIAPKEQAANKGEKK